MTDAEIDDRAFEISQRRMLQEVKKRQELEEQEYLIIEKKYWCSAVGVFTGLTWFLLGIIFAMLVHAIFY